MSSTWSRRPLVVVAITDLLLVAIFGSPWVARWSLIQPGGYSVAKQAVSALIFPGWGAGDTWQLAEESEHWRTGAILRILAFVLLHLLAVRWFARRAAAGDRSVWRGAGSGAWVLGPAVGALAGLATVTYGAFGVSTTVEGRQALRVLAIDSIRDGAYWGMFAGAVCWIVLGFGHRAPVSEGTDRNPRLSGCLPVFMAPVFALLAAGAVAALAGGRAVVKSADAADAGGGQRLAALVSYLHWWTPGRSGSSIDARAPVVALAIYLLALSILVLTNFGEFRGRSRRVRYPPVLPLTNPDRLATAPGLMAFAKGLNAATWAAIVAAFAAAEVETLNVLLSPYPHRSGLSTFAEMFSDEAPRAAAYAALLGWVPALAVLAAARLLRGLLHWVDEAENAQPEEDSPEGSAKAETTSSDDDRP